MNLMDCSERSVLCWLATSGLDATPNVSPKEVFKLINDELMLIANIASPESERNIRSNPQICVSLVDIFEQRGLKIKGSARVVVSDDEQWGDYHSALKELAGESYPIKNIFEVKVGSLSRVLAPSYFLFPETTVDGQVEKALLTYGVQRK